MCLASHFQFQLVEEFFRGLDTICVHRLNSTIGRTSDVIFVEEVKILEIAIFGVLAKILI